MGLKRFEQMLHLSRKVRPMIITNFDCKVILKGALTF